MSTGVGALVIVILTSLAGLLVACFVGLAAHEATHAAVAVALGARILSFRTLPPTPHVVWEKRAKHIDRTIQVAPIVLSVPLVIIIMIVGTGRPLLEQLMLGTFAAAYVPMDPRGADWAPVAGLF
jgi:hypothetical protein